MSLAASLNHLRPEVPRAAGPRRTRRLFALLLCGPTDPAPDPEPVRLSPISPRKRVGTRIEYGWLPDCDQEPDMEPNRALESVPQGCHDGALLNDWHVVAAATDIVPGRLVPLTLFERALVGWRDAAGQVHIWED